MDLSRLDVAPASSLVVFQGGRVGLLPHPAALSWPAVIRCVTDLGTFMTLVGDGAPLPGSVALALQGAWVAHHDLPDEHGCKRLAFTVQRFGTELEVDLGEDLGRLWRARQWRYLMNRIDHLPRTSWYSAAVANDEEFASQLAAVAGDKDEGPYRPPLTHYSPEYELLQSVVNELRVFRAIFVGANSKKGKAPHPELLHGPTTAIARAQAARARERRQARHDALVARVLPHKRRLG